MNDDTNCGRVLVVEDDPFNGPYTAELLRASGFHATLLGSAEEALKYLENNDDSGPDIILLDVNLPGMDGLEMASKLKAHPEYQYVPIIIFTVHDTLDFKIQGLNRGGDDYLTKPFEPDELIARVNAMMRIRRLYQSLKHERRENRRLTQTLAQKLENLLGRSEKMRAICDLILNISGSDSNVLIHGESGTGKEVVAKAIHEQSLRKEGPFVVVNCAAYAETLLQSELFGHEKGAFTGAIRAKKGRFEQANGGAIFLDEIGEVSLPTQVVLLRVIQEKRFERVGGETTLSTDARIIAATNKDLKKCMAQGTFREDLYWRLNVINIHIPPLRERKEDIPQLVNNFIDVFNRRLGKNVYRFSDATMDLILQYHWPGNVRQLENAVERSMVLCKEDVIRPEDLPQELCANSSSSDRPSNSDANLGMLEREHIRSILDQCGWNKFKAAQLMGISRSTLYSKMKKHDLVGPD
ncbi:MAG: sigma-54 dependent transcriptional regulator [Deltaproteobacteria bacterium]|nr:sigma-54 dependent transcriptional regulator [Deltaproteobacteria bacterium]